MMSESGTFVQIQFICSYLEILPLYLCLVKLKQSKQEYKNHFCVLFSAQCSEQP